MAEKEASVSQAFWADFFRMPLGVEVIDQNVVFGLFDKATQRRLILIYPLKNTSCPVPDIRKILKITRNSKRKKQSAETIFHYLTDLLEVTKVIFSEFQAENTYILYPVWPSFDIAADPPYRLYSLRLKSDPKHSYRSHLNWDSEDHFILFHLKDGNDDIIFTFIRDDRQIEVDSFIVSTEKKARNIPQISKTDPHTPAKQMFN